MPEIIDRISILKLKIERGNAELRDNFEKELKECEEAVEEFKRNGIKIKSEWLDRLYEINGFQWNLESKMSELKRQNNLEEMGKVYIELQISNKKRVAVKNEITLETGEGFRDIKIN